MNCTESDQIRLSAWLDGELDRAEQHEAADHLVRCPECRRFWAEARALDGLLAGVRAGSAGPPPDRLWARIRDEAPSHSTRRARRPLVPAWAMRAAASLVLALGLAVVLGGLADDEAAEVSVRLGAGHMDQARFVSMTRELLEADPIYHEAMHRVIGEVLRDTGATEASSEGFGPHLDLPADDEATDRRGPA